jgi:hypothetical protein
MGRLLDYSPENWDKVAASFGFEFGEEHRIALTNVRSYLEALGKKFNIDFIGFHQNYVPHIRRFSRQDLANLLTVQKEAAVQHIFGAKIDNIPALEFLCRNSRRDAVLDRIAESKSLSLSRTIRRKDSRKHSSRNLQRSLRSLYTWTGKGSSSRRRQRYFPLVSDLSGITVGDIGKDVGEFSLRMTSGVVKADRKDGEDIRRRRHTSWEVF